MSDREELVALRRLAELEARAVGTPAPATEPEPSTAAKIAKVATAPIVGPAEAALSLATGTVGSVAGGLSGIAGTALPGPQGQGADWARRVASALTYEPRSDAGQAMTQAVAMPFEALAGAADKAGAAVSDATGSPMAGTVVNTAIQAAPMAIGPLAKAIPGESAAAVAARAKAAALAADADAKLAAARKLGLKVPPSQANAGAIASAAEGLAGEPKVAKLASKKNAPIINDLIRKDLGLPDDVPLSRAALADIRKEAGQAYEAVKSSGTVATDAKYKADLYEISRSVDTAAKDFGHRRVKGMHGQDVPDPLQKTMEGLRVERMDAASAVEEVKLLRNDADKAYRAGDKALGKAYRQAAQALDDQLDRHLRRKAIEGGKDPTTATEVAQYREARTRIAKTYAADKALNDSTGNIDAAKYAAAKRKGAPLTGGAKEVADFAEAFPRAAQRVERVGSTAPTYMDLLLAGVSKEALLLGARPVARSVLLSDAVQNSVAKPRRFGKPRVRSLAELMEQAGTEASLAGVSAAQER